MAETEVEGDQQQQQLGAETGDEVDEEEQEDDDYDDDYDYDDDDNDNDNNNMELTEEERDWAIRIKEIMMSDPELAGVEPPLADMMIAQIALVSMADEEELGGYDNDDNTDPAEKVKERIRGIQRVQHDFEINGTSLEDAKSLMTRWVTDLAPGFLLGFEQRGGANGGSYANVLDLTNFNMSLLSDPDKHLLIMKGFYYLYQCQNLHLSATRNGMISMCEVGGYYWHSQTMASVQAFQAWAELASGYPLHFTSIMHFNTGMLINLATSTAKRLIPPGVAKKFHFGAKLPGESRLNEIYLQPSLEVANQRLLKRLHTALEIRFHNEETFTLGRVSDQYEENESEE